MTSTPDEVRSALPPSEEDVTVAPAEAQRSPSTHPSLSPDSGISTGKEDTSHQQQQQQPEEKTVLDVIAAYEKSLQEELSATIRQQCATTASAAVKALLAAHEAETRALREEQAALQSELDRSSRLVEQLTEQLAAATRTEAQPVHAESTPETQEEEDEKGSSSDEGHRAAARVGPRDTSMADLLADYARAQGRIELLEAEVQHGQNTLQELNEALRRATEENTRLQHELVLLRTSCVPREECESAARERDEAMQQLRLLQLELPKASTSEEQGEASDEASRHGAEEEEEEKEEEEEQQHESEESEQHAAEEHGEEDDEHTDLQALLAQLTAHEPAHVHPTLWQDALRELEAQAMHGNAQHDLSERCAWLTEELRRMESEKAELQSALRELVAEDACVRSDAQSLLFRNGVLSQQLVSLFVKVHKLEKQQQQQRKADVLAQQPLQQQQAQASCAGDTTMLRHSLDIVLRSNGQPPHTHPSCDAAQRPTTLEVTQGVRRSMELYCRPTRARTVALRSLGCIDVTLSGKSNEQQEEGNVCSAPRLPAQDAVHGVALGRPAAYITVDAATGTRTRQGSSAEYLMAASHALQPHTRSEKDGAEVDVQSMLSLMEEGDELDGYSANSIAELVQRNQELLKQVFALTQQQQEHKQEEQVQQGKRERASSSSSPSSPSATSSQHEAARPCKRARQEGGEVHCDVDEEDHEEEENDGIVSDLAADESVEEIDVDDSDDDDDDEGSNVKQGNVPHAGSEQASSKASSKKAKEGEDEEATSRASSPLPAQVQQSAHALVEEVVQRHRRQLMVNDETLASELLRLLQAYKSHNNNNNNTTNNLGSDNDSEAQSPVLRALVELCAGQAVQLAEQAIVTARKAHAEEEGNTRAVQETWAEAQALLRGLAEELRQSLPQLVHAASSTHAENGGEALCDAQTKSDGDDEQNNNGDEERAAVIAELKSLLQTSADREGTMWRVFRTAQARQRARLRERQRRVVRKLRRARQLRATAAAALRLANNTTITMNNTNTATVSAGAVAVGATQTSPRLRALGSASPEVHLPHANVLGTAVEVSPGRASHPGLTPPRPQPLRSSCPRTPTQQDRKNAAEEEDEGEEGVHGGSGSNEGHRRPSLTSEQSSAYTSDSESSHEEDYDDEEDEMAAQSSYEAKLKDRLVHTQAKYADAMQALSKERDQHMSLLERMWQLESEQAAAVHEAAELRSRFDRMIDPQTFADVQTQLNKVSAQLARAEDELQTMRSLRDQAASAQDAAMAEWQAGRAALELSVQELQRELHQRRRDYDQLERRNDELQSHRMHDLDTIHQLEGAAQLHQDERQRMQAALDEMASQCAAAKQEFLSEDHTQRLLQALYPHDAALAANVTLVRHLRDAQAELRGALEAMGQRLHAAQEAQHASERQVRVATQARQDAEARLQEAVQRYESLASLVGATPRVAEAEEKEGEGITNDEEVSRAGDDEPHSAHEEAAGQSGHARGVEGVLRRRVQELEARLELAQREVELVQSAMAAATAREAELREAVQTLSHDPISEAARRYGLKATHRFKEQLAELHDRNEGLRAEQEQQAARVAALQESLSRQTEELAERTTALAELEEQHKTLQAKHDALTVQVAELTDKIERCTGEVEQGRAELDAREARVRALEEQVTQLRAEETALQAQVADGTQARNKLVEDNLALMDRLNELQRDLQQCEEEKAAAVRQYQAALSAAATRQQQQQQQQPRQGRFGPHTGPASVTGDLSARATQRTHDGQA